MPYRFIADVHLGRLAKWLRLLGIDTAYENVLPRPELLKRAVTENRVLLSRSAALAKNPFVHVFVLDTEQPAAQLEQVVRHFGLNETIRPFSRCLVCNHPLQAVDKWLVESRLPPNTRSHFREFWLCPGCQRIYWKGSHYQRMLQRVAQFCS